MADNKIRVVKIAKDNSILCGTNDGFSIIKDQKVIRSIAKNDIIKNSVILTVEGLTSDVVMRIKEDKKNNVTWLVTSNSIQYIKDGKVKKIDSFPYNNNYDLYLNSNNELWVLASSGIYTVDAKSLLSDEVQDYR